MQVEGAGHNDVHDVDREEYDRQIRQFFERMGEESSTKQWAAAGSGGSDLAASLQSRQLS